MAASAMAQTPAPAPAPAIDPAVQVADILETCVQCHGAGGVSHVPTRPTIAGQKAEYVARQLHAFKRAAVNQPRETDSDADDEVNGKPSTRFDPIMGHQTEDMNGALIRRVSAAVSALACDGDEAKPKKVTNLPAMPQVGQYCVACHGVNGMGRAAHIPNLAGQQRTYLRRQLLLIRETAWGAAPRENESWRSHPIMERQAARISIQNVDGLARYYAALDCRGAAQP